MFRNISGDTEYLLVHFGGPFWKNKDEGAWSIPKGENEPGEEMLATAIREFREETGFDPNSDFIALKPIRQKSGKMVHAWALEQDIDAEKVRSNEIVITTKRGTEIRVPEVDRAAWFNFAGAKKRMLKEQFAFIEELHSMGK